MKPINAIPIIKNKNIEVGVPFDKNNGIAKPKIPIAKVTHNKNLRRPILSAYKPEMLVKIANTIELKSNKPVKVLGAIPNPIGWPASESVAGVRE